MATATINGITFNVTMDEMLALANSASNSVPVAKVDNSHAEKVAEVIVPRVRATKSAQSNSDMHEFECGHSEPVSRGRYGALCSECKATGTKMAEKPQAVSETTQTAKFEKRWGRTATTDIEKVRRQVIRFADFALANGLISLNDAKACKDSAATATEFDSLAKVKKALSGIITNADLWAEYMAQR